MIHVEMVEPSEEASGIAGKFVIERVDPAGRSHVALIRLCPRNIRNARVASSPDATVHFLRFRGLTDVADRYAEVLAHELAHAESILGSPERVAEIEAAQVSIPRQSRGLWVVSRSKRLGGSANARPRL